MRKIEPVAAGTTFGCLVSVNDIPSTSTKGQFVCRICKSLESHRVRDLKQKLKREPQKPTCTTCRAIARPKLTDEEKRKRKTVSHRNYRRKRKAKEGPSPRVLHGVRGTRCDHKKELICVDTGEVEIWRCRLCDVVGQPAWTAPRMARMVIRRDRGDDDPSPWTENAVRAMEG